MMIILWIFAIVGICFLFLIVAAFGARYGMELPQSSRNNEFNIINDKLDLLLRNKCESIDHGARE